MHIRFCGTATMSCLIKKTVKNRQRRSIGAEEREEREEKKNKPIRHRIDYI